MKKDTFFYFLKTFVLISIFQLVAETTLAYNTMVNNVMSPPPSNDECDNATFINPSNYCSFAIYNNNSATVSTNTRPATCNFGSYKDVWFKFVAPESGRIIIETQAIDITSGGIALYKGNCNSITTTPVACTFSTTKMPEIDISAGIIPGDTLLLRFWANSSSEFGNFGLCVYSPPPSSTNPTANDLCSSATPICNLNGFSGNTSSSYTNTELSGNNLASVFTNTIENNSWLAFIANSSTIALNIYVNNCSKNLGIEAQILSTSDCKTFTSNSAIWGTGNMENGTITATGLVPGNKYFLMIDGYNGDDCDYVLSSASGITTIYAGRDTTLCTGHAINITANGPTGAGVTYSWSKRDATGLSAVGNGYTKTVTPTQSTTYIVSVSGAKLCNGIKDSLIVTVNSCSCSITDITSIPTCSGKTYSLDGKISYSYQPTSGTLTITDGTKSQIFNAPFSTSSTYSLSGMTPDGLTHTVTATFSALPSCTYTTTYTAPNIPVVTINSPTICAGATAILSANGATLYSWYGGYGTTNPLTVRPTTTKNYIVTATLNGCTSTAETYVYVNPIPTPNITPTSPVICSGQNTVLTASGGTTYLWDNNSTSNSITVSPPNTSNYAVTVTSDKGCTATKGIQIAVNSSGNATASIKPSTICKGDFAVLNASLGDTWKWSSGETTQTFNASPPISTTYTLTVTNSGCTETASVTLTVNDVPTVDAGPNQAICYGNSAIITATSGGTRYQWSSTQIGNIITANPISTTTYTVTMSNANGCTATDNMVLTVNPIPIVTITKNKPITCAGDSIILTASGADTYTWGSFGSSAAIVVKPTNTTIYRVTGTSLLCTRVTSITLSVTPLPSLSVNSPPICINSSVNLTVSGASSYNWSDGLGTTSTVTVNPILTTTYTVTGTTAGCSKSIQSIVTVSTPSIGGIVSGGSTICSGNTSGILTLTGHHGSVVKWQYSTDGVSWTDIANTNTTYTSGVLTQTTQFRAIVQSGACQAANSDETIVTVSPPTIGGIVSGGNTICEGNTSGLLTLAGHIGSIIKWQSSTNGSSWTDITNTNTTYTSGILSETTQYRAVIQSGVCSIAYATATTVTVNPLSISGNVTGGTPVCTGSTSGLLTLSGHSGPINKWQYSADGTNWTDFANTNTTYTSGALTQTTQYRAVVQIGICPAYSGSTTVTVNPNSIGGTVTGGSNICSGNTSNTLTLSDETGSILKWQYSINGSSWFDITNTINTYTSPSLTTTTQYRAIVQSGVCAAVAASPTIVTVDEINIGGTVNGASSVCTGSTSGLLTLTGNTGTISKWQSSVNGGSNWTDIANTNSTYTSGAINQSTQYRAVIQGGTCPIAYSNPANISIDQPSIGGAISGDNSICSGSNVTLSISNYTGSIIKWQSSINSGSTWSDINNTAANYIASNIIQTTLYRAIIQSGACSATNSNVATVTVDASSSGGTIAGATAICIGSSAPTLTLNGKVGNILNWQYSTNNGASWNTISNTNNIFLPGILTVSTQYRASVQNGTCPMDYSNIATITVDALAIGGTITGGTTICSGNPSPQLTLSGNNGIISKWQSSINGGSLWTDVSNTSTTLTPGSITQTTEFRAIVNNGACSAFTNTTSITVTPQSFGGSISGGTTICAGNTSGILTLSGFTGSITKWQSSIDGSLWTDISNNSNTYTSSNITQTTQYRAMVQNGTCSSSTSTTTTVTVNSQTVGGTITQNQTICLGSAPQILNLIGATGNVLQWQISTDGGSSWSNIANNQNSYSPGAIGAIGIFKYRAEIKNGVCPSAFSSAASIAVNTSIMSSFSLSAPQVCQNADLIITYSGNASSAASYNWNFDGGTLISGSQQGPITARWSSSGTHNISLTVIENGCSSLAVTHPIIIKPIPSSQFNLTSTMCPYDTAKIQYPGTPSPGTTFLWNVQNGILINGNSTSAGPLYYKWTNNGTYNASLTVTADGCTSNVTTQNIIVKKRPNSHFSYTDTICPKTNAPFTYTGDAASNAIYNYTFASSASHSGSGNGPYYASWDNAGKYLATLVVTENGCYSTPTTQPIVVRTPPTIKFDADVKKGCMPLIVNFKDTTPNAKSWLWNFNDISSSNLKKPTFSFIESGNYTIRLTVTDNKGCSNTLTKTNFIGVDKNPIADFYWTPDVGSIDYPELTFHALNIPPDVTSWRWIFHDSSKIDTTQITSHKYYNTGDYPVTMYIKSKNGCSDSIVKNVHIKENYSFFIPNAFSPNGDGLNDYFAPVIMGMDLSNFEMYIYSRYGTLVYQTKDITKPWDGTVLSKSDFKKQGVYTWIIYTRELEGRRHAYQGTVTLIGD